MQIDLSFSVHLKSEDKNKTYLIELWELNNSQMPDTP